MEIITNTAIISRAAWVSIIPPLLELCMLVFKAKIATANAAVFIVLPLLRSSGSSYLANTPIRCIQNTCKPHQ